MYDLLVRNGKLVTPDRIYEADIAIQDGKYAAFLAKGTEAEAKRSNRRQRKLCLPRNYRLSRTPERTWI